MTIKSADEVGLNRLNTNNQRLSTFKLAVFKTVILKNEPNFKIHSTSLTLTKKGLTTS